MKPKIRVRMAGTRTNKLRARVEINDPDGLGDRRFEVTIGGENWEKLSKDLQKPILERAEQYIKNLQSELWRAQANYDPIPF